MESTGWGNRDFSPGFLGRLGHKLAFIFCVCRSKDFVPDLPVEYDRIVDYDAARSDVIRRVVSSCWKRRFPRLPGAFLGHRYALLHHHGGIYLDTVGTLLFGACKMSGSDFGMLYNAMLCIFVPLRIFLLSKILHPSWIASMIMILSLTPLLVSRVREELSVLWQFDFMDSIRLDRL